ENEPARSREHAGSASHTERRRQRHARERRIAAQRWRIAEGDAPLDRAAIQVDRDEMAVRRLEQWNAILELRVRVADARVLGVDFRRARVRAGSIGLAHARDGRLT